MNKHITAAIKSKVELNSIAAEAETAQRKAKIKSGWRIDGTLREFPKFDTVNVWFNYPIHEYDSTGVLNDIKLDEQPWKKNIGGKKKKTPEESKKERNEALETAINACSIDEKITLEAMAEFMGVSEKTVRRRLKEHGNYEVESGIITSKDRDKDT